MNDRAKILVIDDDRQTIQLFGNLLGPEGYTVIGVTDPLEAMLMIPDLSIDLVITDVNMPHLSGFEVLKAFKNTRDDVEVIVMADAANVEGAVQAMQIGAFDYLAKPFTSLDALRQRVERAVERRAQRKRAPAVNEAAAPLPPVPYEGMIGHSPPITEVFRLVEQVGPTNATVLVRGESGTGKELIAKALHYRSPRYRAPFVAVNCSALTETLLESELFGHVKGAFTGANGTKRGLFEAANGGTIFLDEVGDMAPATQVRLLRALQEGEIKRVGSTDTISVDTRVVAATNVDLERARANGRFREDLYYRLNVVTLSLPALRERPTDIPLLAQHFVRTLSRRIGRKVVGISPIAMRALVRCRWVGNVRELENVIERAIILAQKELIELSDLPENVRGADRANPVADDRVALTHLPFSQAKALAMGAFERRYITTMLERNGGNISAAASAAGMDRANFRRQMRHAGLFAEEKRESA